MPASQAAERQPRAGQRGWPDHGVEQKPAHVREKLPSYKRPYFLRLQREMKVTGTFKHQKVEYRRDGYDPSKCDDPLYWLDGERYVAIDTALYERLQSRRWT